MQHAMAEHVAEKLESRPEVKEASIEEGYDGPIVRCVCHSEQDKWDVKADLGPYPVYVELEVADGPG